MVLAIYGAGGFGIETLNLALQINKQKRWKKIVFIDDVTDKKAVYDISVYPFAEFKKIFAPSDCEIAIAIGEPESRALLAERVNREGYELAVLVHPSAEINDHAKIGKGTLIFGKAYVSAAEIGENAVVMMFALVGHGCRVGASSVISSGAAIGGDNQIGDKVFVGMGAATKENISLGDNSAIALNAAVLKDVPPDVVVLGNPAKVVAKKTKIFR
jgi:sugar O-acyltransferase (sialic acid O-acetyltransferase NeuD family)